jgi:hypothetical protein
VNEVINSDQPGAVRTMYSTASVANDEIADSYRTILFLKPTMAVAETASLTRPLAVAILQRRSAAAKITARYNSSVSLAEMTGRGCPCKVAYQGGRPWAQQEQFFRPLSSKWWSWFLTMSRALLPEAKRTSTIKVEIASKILACAAKGERDPIAMKAAALLIWSSFNVRAIPTAVHRIARQPERAWIR